jgi:ubiquinone/menaquinone biosynthesis C-methylase UbiE
MGTTNATYPERVTGAFDNVAELFDELYENEITRRIRQQVYNAIESLIPQGSSILDINCGTGIDAIALAQQGYIVVGIDIAPKMVERSVAKAAREGLENAKFYAGSFERLTETVTGQYDLVLSNFGGLNCVSSLHGVADQVARVTKPGGHFVAVVMPPFCLWEMVAGLARLNVKAAFRRLHKNVAATGFRGKTFTVYYHSSRGFAAAFSRSFTVETVRGLNIISPPPHATRFVARFPGFSRRLERIEPAISSLPLLRSMGDHFVIVLRRSTL